MDSDVEVFRRFVEEKHVELADEDLVIDTRIFHPRDSRRRRRRLPEIGVDTTCSVAAVHPLGELQIEYSLISRGPERAIFRRSTSSASASLQYGALSRAFAVRTARQTTARHPCIQTLPSIHKGTPRSSL